MRNNKEEKRPTRVTRSSDTRVAQEQEEYRAQDASGRARGHSRGNDRHEDANREVRRENADVRRTERAPYQERARSTEGRDLHREGRTENRKVESQDAERKQALAGKRRGNAEDRAVHQLFPYALFCLSIFAAVSIFLRDVIGIDDGAGAFGSFLGDFLAGLFGYISYLTPAFAFLLALRWRSFVRRKMLIKKLFLSFSFLFLLSGIVHVFLENSATRGVIDVRSELLYANGVSYAGGGFFGGFVGEYLGYIFHLPGTILLAVPLLVIIGIYLIGMTPVALWQRIVCKFRLRAKARAARRAEKYDGVEEPQRKPRKKADEREELRVRAERSQTALAVTQWCEPRPLEKKEPARERYVFSDLEDDPIPISMRSAKPAPEPSVPPVESVVEPVVETVGDEAEAPSVAQSPWSEVAEAPASAEIVPPVVTVSPTQSAPDPTDFVQAQSVQASAEESHRESCVYAPFALPIKPFPTKEAAPASTASESAEPQSVQAPASAPCSEAPMQNTVQPQGALDEISVVEKAPTAPLTDANGEEILGAFGHIGTVAPKAIPKPAPNPMARYSTNPAERYAHQDLYLHQDPVPAPAPSFVSTPPVQEECGSETSSAFLFEAEESTEEELASPFVKAETQDVAFATDTAKTAEREDILPPVAFEFTRSASISEPVAVDETEVDEPEEVDEKEFSFPPAATRAEGGFTFDREHISSPAPSSFVENEGYPRKSEGESEKGAAPTQSFAAFSPARTPATPVVPKAVPVKSAPIKEEEPEPVYVPPREYVKPPLHLLNEDKNVRTQDFYEEIEETKDILRQTMSSFNIKIQDDINYSHGPSVTRYEMRPVAGTSVRSVTNRTEDIALNLASSVRIEAPIPGKPAIGIEVPNKVRETVYMRTMLESEQFKNSEDPLDVPLGLDVGGVVRMCNLAKMPHLLVAGTTGSGKSVCINSILVSLIYKTSPADLRLILIDPKQIEFAPYEHVPHLYMPIVTDMQRAAGALACAVQEMERRFSLIKDVGVRNIEAYNEAVKNDPEREHLPYIIIVIDEFADLKMSCNNNDPENFTCRIAQKARAAGMHLIIGTQRPSVDVITGKLKTNIPSRIAFMVKQQVDSRTILDVNGAEALTGRGDMLYMPTNSNDKNPVRIQGAYVSDGELERVISYVKKHNDPVQYNQAFMDQIEVEMARNAKSDRKGDDFDYDDEEEGGEDPKFVEAVELAVQTQKVATSLLQRRLGVGYGRAAKIIDRMEELGLVSAAEGNKPRKLLPAAQGYLDHLAGIANAEEDGEDYE